MTASNETCFTNSVESAFSFLVKDRGYSASADAENGVVAFESDQFTVKVFREPRSDMIYVEFRRKDTGEEFLLHEILHALAPDSEPQAQCCGAEEYKEYQCLTQLSQLCERHLGEFLAMDRSTLDKVASSARSKRTQYTHDAQYGAIKDRANQAWERKDWQRALELYEEAKPGLSGVEERRLDFLLKKGL